MDLQRSGSFLCKKWSLFSVSLLGIISAIVMASIASSLVDSIARSYPNDYTEDVKSVAKSMIIAVAVISSLFNLLGLLGAYKENFCLTMTYAILMTLGFLGGISVAVKTPTYWYSTVLSLIICVLAYAFARDLHILRNQMFATPVFVGSAQPQTVVHITPGYSNQYNGQMGGQQYPSQPGGWQPPPPAYNADPYKS